jgi:hypothetical protein
MRFENTWLIIVSSIIAAATIAGAILFVIARDQQTPAQTQVSIPKLSDDEESSTMPVEEFVTKVVYMLSPGNPDRLVPIEREVFNLIPQSRVAGQLLQELMKGPGDGDSALSPLPNGSRLKNLYFSDRGIAVVILNQETRLNHPGGTKAELLSIYSIVNTLCINFPFVQAVQIVIEDAPDNTFAGHIDISYPLPLDMEYITGRSASPEIIDETESELPLADVNDGQEANESLQ